MSDRKQDEESLHFERYVLTLQHQYVTQECKTSRTIDIDEPIKIMYMVNPFGQYTITPKVVVINEMFDKMRDHLLNQVKEME